MSSSLRGVVMRLWPGRRRSSSACSSSRLSCRRGGTPSTTQPTPPPWLSPNVVTLNAVPNVFANARVTAGAERRRPRLAARAGSSAGGQGLEARILPERDAVHGVTAL